MSRSETPKAAPYMRFAKKIRRGMRAAKRQPVSTRPYQTSRSEASRDDWPSARRCGSESKKAIYHVYKLPAFSTGLFVVAKCQPTAGGSATTTESQHFDQLKHVVQSVIITNDIRLSRPCSGYLKHGMMSSASVSKMDKIHAPKTMLPEHSRPTWNYAILSPFSPRLLLGESSDTS